MSSNPDLRFWLSDVKSAYDEVKKRFNLGELPISEKREFYKVASLIVAGRKNIKDDSLIEKMNEVTNEIVEHDFLVDPNSKIHYQFHFVISYVHAHIPLEIITEIQADDVMGYINEKWDLFKNA